MTRTRPWTRHVLAVAAALLATACSGAVGGTAPPGPTPAPAPPPAGVVPTAWLDAAAAAWPDTDGRKDGVMVFGGARQCVLGEQRVRVLDLDLRWNGSGYGPVVPGPAGVYGEAAPGTDTAAGFVHLCRLWAPSRAAGSVTLTRYPDAAGLQEAVSGFRDRPDTPVQDNEVSRLTSGRYTVDALRRWYPTNPQGAYQVMVVDEPQRATLVLEVNSLSRADFEATSAQAVADAFTDFLARSEVAPAAGPPQVPSWADSVWQDAARSFHIAVAKGWAQDPAAGDQADETTLARFRTADRSGALTVLPTSTDGPQSRADTVAKARTVAARNGYTVVGEEPITLDDGRAADRIDMTHAGRHFAIVIVLADRHFFQVIGSAPTDRWDAVQDDVLRMARSFAVEG